MIRQNTPTEVVRETIEKLPKDTIIGEFAGRDSVAAIMEALKDPAVKHILPVITFAPTEYGSEKELEVNYHRMVEVVKERYGREKQIHPLLYYSSLPLWRILNGRYVMQLQREFGFYTPCIGCHVYFHLARIPLAKQLGKKIIAGERESHGGKIKVNQMKDCLDSYQRILQALDIQLMLPIRRVESGEEVEELIGWNWAAEEEQPVCLFSGNYRDHEGNAIYDRQNIQGFLTAFLEPLSIYIGKHYQENPAITEAELETLFSAWEAQR